MTKIIYRFHKFPHFSHRIVRDILVFLLLVPDFLEMDFS